jgi:hypothetical protein
MSSGFLDHHGNGNGDGDAARATAWLKCAANRTK